MNMIDRLKRNNLLKVFPEEQEIMDARSNMLNQLEARRQSINPLNDLLINMGAGMMSGDPNEMPLQSLGRGLKEGQAAFKAAQQQQDAYSVSQMKIHEAVSNSIQAVREFEQKKSYQDQSLGLEREKLKQTKELEMLRMRREQNKAFYEEEAKEAAKDISKAENAKRFLPSLMQAVNVINQNPDIMSNFSQLSSMVTGDKNKEVSAVRNAITMVNELYRLDTGDKGGKPLIPTNANSEQIRQILNEYTNSLTKLVNKSDAMQKLVKEHGYNISEAKNALREIDEYNEQYPNEPVDYEQGIKKKEKDLQQLRNEVQPAVRNPYRTNLEQEALNKQSQMLSNIDIRSPIQKAGGSWVFDPELGQMRMLNPDETVPTGDRSLMQGAVELGKTLAIPSNILQWGINKAKGVPYDKTISQALEDYMYTLPGFKENKPIHHAENFMSSIATMPAFMGGMGTVGKGLLSAGEKISKLGQFAPVVGKPLEWAGKFLKAGSNPLIPADIGLNVGSEIGGSLSDNPLFSIPLAFAGGHLGAKAGEGFVNKALKLSFNKDELAKAAGESIIDVMKKYNIPSLPADTLNQIFKFVEGMSIASFAGLRGNKIVKTRKQQEEMIEKLLIDQGVSKEVAGSATKEIMNDVRQIYSAPKNTAWDKINAEIDEIAKDVPLSSTLDYFETHLKKLEGDEHAIEKLLTDPIGRLINDLVGKSHNLEKGKYKTIIVDNQPMKVRADLAKLLSSQKGLVQVMDEIKRMPREHVKRIVNRYESKYKKELSQKSKDQGVFELSEALRRARADMYVSAEEALHQKYGKDKVEHYRELRKEHAHYKKFEETEVNRLFANENKSDTEFFEFFVNNAQRNGEFTKRIMNEMHPDDVMSFRSSFNRQLGFDPYVAGGENKFNSLKFAKNYNKMSEEAKRTIYGDQKHLYDDLTRVIHNIQSAVGGYNMSNTYNVGSILKQAAAGLTLGAGLANHYFNQQELKGDAQAAGMALLASLLGYKFAGNTSLAKSFVGLSKSANKTDYARRFNILLQGADKEVPSSILNALKNEIFRNLPEKFTSVYDEKESKEQEEFDKKYSRR